MEGTRFCARLVRLAFPASMLLSALAAGPALAQTRAPGTDKPETPQQLQYAEVQTRLAAAWTAALSGKHDQAIQLAEPIAGLKEPRYARWAIEAAHITARSYLAVGTRQSITKARQVWTQLERFDSKATRNRLITAKALMLEAETQGPNTKSDNTSMKLKAAINLLEPMLAAPRWNVATVEAALDLSRLYVKVKRFDDARKTLNYIVSYLEVEQNIIIMEIPRMLAEPYAAAAKAMLQNLKFDANLGLREFEAAEAHRKAGRFAEAMRGYQALTLDMPQSAYAAAAEFHIGSCLMGLGRHGDALAHWRKFIESKPAGEYRAQAMVALIDIYLEEQLNLPDAARYAEVARATLPTALADEKAGPS